MVVVLVLESLGSAFLEVTKLKLWEILKPSKTQNRKKTRECMKGTGRTLGSRKPMSQEENPVIHLHMFPPFGPNAWRP